MKFEWLKQGVVLAAMAAVIAGAQPANSEMANEGKDVYESAERTGALYDFQFVNSDIKTVFKAIAVRAGVDILPAPNIQGKVNLTISQKTWQQALEILCNLYELAWLIEEEYVFVLTKAEYQNRLEKAASNDLQYDLIAPKVQKIYHIKHADVAELEGVIRGVKSSQGQVTIFKRNNAIVVYDNEARQAKIDSVIAILDVATKQVLITAKLVVVTNTFEERLGVEWFGKAGNGSAPGTGTTTSAPASIDVTDSRTVIEASNGTSGGSLRFGLLQGKIGVDLQQFLADNNTELVAHPQISTLDHKMAKIQMGTQRSFRVLDANGVPSQQLVDANIELTVTPHVIGADRIRMELKPKNNSFGSAPDGGLQIETQEANTEIVVRNGQTAVIAGLTRNQESEVERGVPFLKDIPLIGYLFKSTETKVEKKDLIIFITPYIIDVDENGEILQEKLLEGEVPVNSSSSEEMGDNNSDFQ